MFRFHALKHSAAVFFSVVALSSAAQTIPAGVNGNNSAINRDSSTQDDGVADTAHIVYFYASDRQVVAPEKDSLLDQDFQQYDPARRGVEHYHLGVVGSAAYPLLYRSAVRQGFDLGLHAYDLYEIKPHELKFYQQTKAFTDVKYSAQQLDNRAINVRFGRRFADGIHLSIDYRNINNSGLLTADLPSVRRRLHDVNSGILYDMPLSKNTALALGVWIERPRYNGFLTFTSHSFRHFNRGGIESDSIFATAPAQGRFTSLVSVLSNASTLYQKTALSYLQYYQLNRQDSANNRQYLLSHEALWQVQDFLSSDPFSTTPTALETAFYGPLLNDTRGLRLSLVENRVENSFKISTTRSRDGKNGVRSDWFEVGLTHAFHAINPETTVQRLNNVMVTGRWTYSPNDYLKWQAKAHFVALGYNAGDYKMAAELLLNAPKWGNLTLKAHNQLFEPSWLQDNLYLTQRLVWQNNFRKTVETQVAATLRIPKWRFSATGAYTLLNNYIYYDAAATPRQTSTPLSIVQLTVEQQFKGRHWGLDNTVTVQQATEAALPLPTLFTKNSLYWEGRLFKKVMLARAGLDVRYASRWSALAYMPLTAQFFVQETGTVAPYPAVDAFFSFKVQTLRFFVKMENLVGDYAQARYYQTWRYPMPEGTFRFGLQWLFIN